LEDDADAFGCVGFVRGCRALVEEGKSVITMCGLLT
jgi:hypothetical protein